MALIWEPSLSRSEEEEEEKEMEDKGSGGGGGLGGAEGGQKEEIAKCFAESCVNHSERRKRSHRYLNRSERM